MTNITQIPQKQAIRLMHEAETEAVEEFIKSLDLLEIKLKGIKKELLRLK